MRSQLISNHLNMLTKYNRVRNKLLPQGTRRRGAYELGLTGVRTISNEGWRSFFRKMRIWLRYRKGTIYNNRAGVYSRDVKKNFSKQIISEKFLNIDSLCGCYICGALFEYPTPSNVANLRETILCHNCGAIKRHNDVARILLEVMESRAPCLSEAKQDLHNLKIYLPESYGPIYNVLSRLSNFVCSEFWDDLPVGTTKDNVRCEDVQNLTFPDESFDIIITQDIFEHIADPKKGFKEIYRVLKPVGYFIFTVPVDRSLKSSRIRAIVEDNNVHHILPPSYHEDRLRRDGILVFTDFGLDLVAILEEIGFKVKTFEDEHPDYAGGYNSVFTCKKTLLNSPIVPNTITKGRNLEFYDI